MAVITPPDLTTPPIEELAATDETLPPMTRELSAKLITRSAMTIPELRTALKFFKQYAADSLLTSPAVASMANRDAIQMYDKARQRLYAARNEARRVQVPEDDPDLPAQISVGR